MKMTRTRRHKDATKVIKKLSLGGILQSYVLRPSTALDFIRAAKSGHTGAAHTLAAINKWLMTDKEELPLCVGCGGVLPELPVAFFVLFNSDDLVGAAFCGGFCMSCHSKTDNELLSIALAALGPMFGGLRELNPANFSQDFGKA